jgi:hypothetical protein
MWQDLPWLWLDHHVSADSKVRRLGVKLDAFQLEFAAVLEPGDFIFKALCFYDLLM